MNPSQIDELRFTVMGEPQGKGRPRASSLNGMVRMYTPKATRDGEQSIQAIAKRAMNGKPPLTGPVAVQVMIRHGVRKSWTKAKRTAALLNEIAPTIKSDLDNVLKLYFDAMNGVVWDDDVQVVNVIASKRFAEEPHVTIQVTPLKMGSA